ncbi:MAG TPA: TRZ/ATZ family hydrolase [Gammaproteobacteria bacterium]
MKYADMVINARWIIPVEPDGAVYENHSLVVQDGIILDLLPATQAKTAYQGHVTYNLGEHALIPGLVNAHTHAAMSLFRGLADDLPLMNWLNNHIWPAEGAWVSSEFVHDGTQLAIAEMLRGGTTCFNDMYFFPDAAARVASSSGIRAAIGLIIIDFPTAWASDAQEYLNKGLELHDHYRNDPMISTVFAPHAPYTVSDQPLTHIQTLAEELDIPIHIHVHETEDEITRSHQHHNGRPLQRLERLGLVTPRLLAVHMTQLLDDEIELMASAGAHVIHCPESNLKLASGFCPAHKLQKAGVNVALGTDGAASNNDLDMFGEMRTAALLAKAVANDASAVPAATALRMATLNGARALGLDEVTGSLVKGKAADMVAVYMGDIESTPIYHPVSQIVYATGRDKVTDVWAGGRQLVKDRALITLDESAIRKKALLWQTKIASRDQQQ